MNFTKQDAILLDFYTTTQFFLSCQLDDSLLATNRKQHRNEKTHK